MSYAIRNTIILFMVLALLLGGGYAYIMFFQIPQIEELEEDLEQVETELQTKQQTAAELPALRERFEESERFIEEYDKTLFDNNNPDRVYRFLSIISSTDPVEFDYVFNDSTSTDQYGVLQSQITGSGSYRAVLNFISRIEHSPPVQKIDDITITPINEVGRYGTVNFSFQLQSFYDNQNAFSTERTPGVAQAVQISQNNPFYPLIRNVEPNEDDLLDAEESRLVGIGSGRVYLQHQNGQLVTLRENDEVYLGRLETIDMNAGEVTFRLNKGGIIDLITLEVQR